MDLETARALATEMGVHQNRLEAVRRAPNFEIAQKQLEAFKEDVRRNYRQMAFKYHPDRNPGDALAEEKFKVLAQLRDRALELKLQPRPRITAFVQYAAVSNATPAPTRSDVFRRAYSGTTQASTSSYDARRVVFIRVT